MHVQSSEPASCPVSQEPSHCPRLQGNCKDATARSNIREVHAPVVTTGACLIGKYNVQACSCARHIAPGIQALYSQLDQQHLGGDSGVGVVISFNV